MSNQRGGLAGMALAAHRSKENNIQEHADIPEVKFDRVACELRPVPRDFAIDDELRHREESACKVQHNVVDAAGPGYLDGDKSDTRIHTLGKGGLSYFQPTVLFLRQFK